MRKLTVIFTALIVITGFCFAQGSAEEIIIKDGERIAFLGDSITNAGASYGAYCRLVIQGLKSKGITVDPVFAGVSGDTSMTMLLRLDRAVLDHKPDWVFLSAGVNDIWHHDPTVKISVFQAKPGMGVGLEDYKKYVTRIVERCQAAGANVILSTITPIKEDPDFKLNRQAVEYNKFLYKLAKEKNLPIAKLHEAMFAKIAEAKKEILAKKLTRKQSGHLRVTSDGVHPLKPGHYTMAKGILKAMGLSDASVSAAEKQWDNSQKLLFLGDRITAGGGRAGSWQHLILDRLNAGKEMVISESKIAYTAKDFLKNFKDKLATSNFKYVVVQFSRGDVEEGTPFTEFKKQVTELVRLANRENVKPVMISIPVANNLPGSELNKKINACNDILRQIAKDKQVAFGDVNAAMAEVYKSNPARKLTFDGLRFNYDGDVLMAKTALEAFGYSPFLIAKLYKTWDNRPSYTFGASHRVVVYINLSESGFNAIEDVYKKYHGIGVSKFFRVGMHLMVTEGCDKRIAEFDKKWINPNLPAGKLSYQKGIRFNFSKNEVRAIEAAAKKKNISLQEFFNRAFKVSLYAMLAEDVLGLQSN